MSIGPYVTCKVCDGTGVVCENHRHLPWDGESDHPDACGCGAGAPCLNCSDEPGRKMGTGMVLQADGGANLGGIVALIVKAASHSKEGEQG